MAGTPRRRGPAAGSSLWRIRRRTARRQQPRVRLRGPPLSAPPITIGPGDIPAHWRTATHTPRANLVRRRLDFVARPLLPAIRRPDRCVREDDPLVGHRGPYALRRALHGARPPGLMLVREP